MHLAIQRLAVVVSGLSWPHLRLASGWSSWPAAQWLAPLCILSQCDYLAVLLMWHPLSCPSLSAGLCEADAVLS
jgi:hypothetical protein